MAEILFLSRSMYVHGLSTSLSIWKSPLYGDDDKGCVWLVSVEAVTHLYTSKCMKGERQIAYLGLVSPESRLPC